MVPKFANPHSLSQDVEKTTRSEIAGRSGFTLAVQDENSDSLRCDLDKFLRDTWGDTLAEASRLTRSNDPEKMSEKCENEDDRTVFRLLSSMKHPQCISLDPKPPPIPVLRGPACEDDETQAETRRMHSLAVAVELRNIGESVGSTRKADHRPVGTKVPLADACLVRPLPPLLLIEETRARKTIQQLRTQTQVNESVIASPHEPRVSCTVLTVKSARGCSETRDKKCRKPARERPQPAYWRPPPELRGKCMGYALGYPSSWAPGQTYVRDAMK